VSDVDNSPSPSLPRLEPGATFAGYRIEALLDRGGMGVVYRATDPDLDREVALKIIAPEHTQNPVAVARFKAEARLAASLEHPNIVPVHRGGEHDGVLYLAMRLVPGTNLRQIIDRGPLDLARVARIISEIGDAIDTAHAAGLVHRDIKPANILLSGQGHSEHAYLADFGLTKRLGSAGDLTRTGGWVGTPDYVAPEQIQGHSVDGRADIYSLGCVVYEMLTGHVAYPKDSHMAKLWAHVTDPPPLPRRDRPDLVESFDAVVAHATAKEPNDRFKTAGELAGALRSAVGEQEAKRQFDAAQATEIARSAERDTTQDDELAKGPAVAAVAGNGAPPRDGSPPPAVAGGLTDRGPQPAVTTGGGSPVPVVAGGGDGSAAPTTARPRWRRRWPLAAAVLLLLLGAGIAAIVLSGDPAAPPSPGHAATAGGKDVDGELAPVPANRVRGVGEVKITLKGTTAKVHLTARGLLNGFSHAMHIHAGAKGQCPPGSAAQVHNGFLSMTTKDGAPFYGHPITSLTKTGDTSKKSFLDFTRFPADGDITYDRTIPLDPVDAATIRQGGSAVVVIHGIDYNRSKSYDFSALDRSDLDRKLPAEETAPALCGALIPQASGNPTASGTHVYTTTLAAAPAPRSSSPFLCHLGSFTGTLL
jgi:protein kinase-like protein